MSDTSLKAVLVGLQTDEEDERFARSLSELDGLCTACMVEPVSVITQRASHPDHATCIGSGKVQEVKEALYIARADLVIFHNSLSPVQVRNLGRQLDTEVIDKTDLILRIFSERAKSREARLQVEYARLDHMLPRLVGMRENLSRQGGASGFLSSRGAGETQLELDRRRIINRQAQLRRELREMERARTTQSEGRRMSGLYRVGLVGYTNAGKSTLMNTLLSLSAGGDPAEQKTVYAEDMLFATLDTTVRKIAIKGQPVFLLSDTVGFIRDLPTALIKAFQSTLQEAVEADLLLEVVDCTDEDHPAQSEVTRKTLAEIGAGRIPLIRVMNKAEDLHDASLRPGMVRHAESAGAVTEVYISAKRCAGIDVLLDLIVNALDGPKGEYTFLVPYADGKIVTQLSERAEVLSQEFTETGTRLRVICGFNRAVRYADYMVPE